MTLAGQAAHTWAASTSDGRAVQYPTGGDRIAATWYQSPSFDINVNLTDGQPHQVALYALDWDGADTRAQTIEVLDAATGAVLDSRSVTAFSGGQYLVWQLSGHVRFRVKQMGISNAVIAGLFFGSSPPRSRRAER